LTAPITCSSVYRLFFISKAPSFYIIRSSLVSIGGVYGEQVRVKKVSFMGKA
jgi:hypothetical protein